MCKELKIAIAIWLVLTLCCAFWFRNSSTPLLVVRTIDKDYYTDNIELSDGGKTAVFIENNKKIIVKEPFIIELRNK